MKLDGKPVTGFKSKKIRGLLSYLAVESARPHSREALAGLFWPDWPDSDALSNLRYALSNLRRAIGDQAAVPPYLIITRDTLQFNTASDHCLDVAAFENQIAFATGVAAGMPKLTDLEVALELYRGPFLEGFSIRDCAAFDEWSTLKGQQVSQLRLAGVRHLAKSFEGQNEIERALVWARRLIELDPWDEAAHRQLMRLLLISGRRSVALAHYDSCRQLLWDELGVKPSVETTTLYETIRKGEPIRVKTPEVRPASQMAEVPKFLESETPHQTETPSFVARDRELNRLKEYLDRVIVGRGRIAFVIGETGSGKSALIQEFTRRAQLANQDLVVASGYCNAYTGIGDPYLPFREILEQLTGDVEAKWEAGAISSEHARRLWCLLPVAAEALVEEGRDLIDTFVSRDALRQRVLAGHLGRPNWLARLDEIGDQMPFGGRGTPSAQQSNLLEQYSKVLRELAKERPLLLVVDDLQWADSGSVSLLFHLGRHLADKRIFIIGAYRPEEVAIGRKGERHPLEPVVNEFQREFGDITVNLRKADRRAFVEALIDNEANQLGQTFREMLYRQTQGHPLFSIELLRGMQQRGDLVKDTEGRWVEGPTLKWQMIPARVEAVIEERISRLPRTMQVALHVACVEGEVFTAEVVAQVLETVGRDLIEQLSGELDRRHRLIQAQAINRVGSRRLSHYRFRNYLTQSYLYNNLDPVERAYLHEDVGTVLEEFYGEKKNEIMVQLAWHFQEAGINEKAVPYLSQAGARAVQLAAYQEGIAHLNNGLDLLKSLPESPERGSLELDLQLSRMIAYQGLVGIRSPETIEAFTRAHQLCQQIEQSTQLGRVLEEMVEYYYVGAEYHKARELAEDNLKVAEEAGNPLQLAICHWNLGFIAFGMGEFEPAHDHFQKVIDSYDPKAHHLGFVSLSGKDAGIGAMAQDACCLWVLGYPEQAALRSQETLRLAHEVDHPFVQVEGLCFAACQFNAMRRDVAALKEGASKLIRLTDSRFPGWAGNGECYLGESLIRLGQPDQGIAHSLNGLEKMASMEIRIYTTGMRSALALGQAMAGRPHEGLATLDQTLVQVEQTGERYWEAEIYRIRAVILFMEGAEAEAQNSLVKAIEIARRQRGKSLELRAAVDLARLWLKQDKLDEALQILEPILSWFSEGFDTPDLMEARALLSEISESAGRQESRAVI